MAVTIKSFTRASEVDHGISGDSDSRNVVYRAVLSEPVADENSDFGDALILSHAESTTPIAWDGMLRTGIGIDQIAPTIFRVTAQYSRKDPQALRNASATLSFDVSLENVKTYIAINQQKFGAEAPDHQKFINVTTEDGKTKVEGFDVPRPVQELEISIRKNYNDLTDAFLWGLEQKAGMLNNATWRGRPKGSVLFRGYRVQVSTDGETELVYKFGIKRPPTLPLTIGGVTIPVDSGPPSNIPTEIFGWDVIWAQWKTAEDPGVNDIAAGAKGVYVSRVFELTSFATLGV